MLLPFTSLWEDVDDWFGLRKYDGTDGYKLIPDYVLGVERTGA
jgi:hypothetical protein